MHVSQPWRFLCLCVLLPALFVPRAGGAYRAGHQRAKGRRWNALLVGNRGVDAVGKLLGLGKVGQLALHPHGVAVRAVGDGAVDGAVAAALEAVVALAGAGGVPVKVDVLAAEDAAGDGAGLGVALALGLGGVLCLGGGLVADGRGGVDGGGDGVVEAGEAGGGEPLVLDALQGVARLAGGLGGDHEVVEGLQLGVGGAEDEGVVAGVDGGGDEGGGLGVGAGDGDEVGACIGSQSDKIHMELLNWPWHVSSRKNNCAVCCPLCGRRGVGGFVGSHTQQLSCKWASRTSTKVAGRHRLTHNVGLGADGDEAANVLADGDEDLAGHVAALLGAGGLVLDVDAGGALLDEELGELHDGGEAAVARVGVGDDGPQVVNVGDGAALGLGRREALLALLAVVEELRHEEVADLVGDSGLGDGERLAVSM